MSLFPSKTSLGITYLLFLGTLGFIPLVPLGVVAISFLHLFDRNNEPMC